MEEAAAALRVDISDVIEAIRGGALPGNELRGHWRINSADLETWLKGAWRQ
ncbi:helix-turn-helix domain-containing protein [Cellulomonas aerilata]|uniref:helix-turn-helix domain-containing protein n=1 Tax=Cellulomonas aerilata TaxID=515326 RepID=UPI002482E05F